ncbi:MAG: right-handed parallel beta-helix repeat-containing protein [Pseudomonadota bacterium]|nr:right-handed parallel beta-helix repeat-containing protein [Pseudomonadota bacterium]
MGNLQITDGKQIRYLVLISIVAFAGNLPRIAIGNSFVPIPIKTKPIVSVKSFGAKGDGVKDDTQAIQNAMNSMTNGGTLEFPAGTYKYSKALKLTKPNVKLWGYGATLKPTNVNSHAIQLIANNTHIYGFRKESPWSWKRGGCQPHGVNCYSIVALNSSNHQIIDNKVRYATGIFALSSTNVLIGRNTVYRTYADAIHVTGRSSDVKISQNTVRENGDDMIAVVSYGQLSSYRVNNVLIEDNDVAGNYWGRGIAVVGGKDITIRNNLAQYTAHGPGILLYSETNKKGRTHPPVSNVLVENNTIRHVQTTAPVYNPKGIRVKLGWGGIHIAGYHLSRNFVENVMVRNNVVHTTYRDGITVTGYVSKVGLVGNALYNVGRNPIGVIDLKRNGKKIACYGNTYNGKATSNPKCGAPMPNVTGSAL